MDPATAKLLWTLVFTPAWAPVQATLHESSHAVIPALQGVPFTRFSPYPHFSLSESRFVLGEVRWKRTPEFSDSSRFWTVMAPRIMDVALLVGAAVLRRWAKDNPWLWGFLTAVQLWAASDFVFNTFPIFLPQSLYGGTDAWRAYDAGHKAYGHSPQLTAVASGALVSGVVLFTAYTLLEW